MSPVDWIVVALVALMALFGYAQGFLAGALSLAGFALGAWVGTRVAPLLLDDGKDSVFAPLFALCGALVVGVVLAAGFEGVGTRARFVLRRVPGVPFVDGALGAVLMGCVGLGLAWVLGAVALQTPGVRELRDDIQRSTILARLNQELPSRRLLNALARFDPFPRIAGPDIDLKPPPRGIARDPQVAAAEDSVVQVLGTACGLGVGGSGWVAAPGVVVTNAHVVAGQEDTTVHPGGGAAGLDTTVVHYDARNDVAVLRVPGLEAPSLPLADSTQRGTAAAVLGYPLDGPYRARPVRLGSAREILTQDSYGQGRVRRAIVSLRGKVQPGNSGGPLVNRRGRVVGTVFAAVTGVTQGGYAVPNATVRAALDDARGAVSTGPCAR